MHVLGWGAFDSDRPPDLNLREHEPGVRISGGPHYLGGRNSIEGKTVSGDRGQPRSRAGAGRRKPSGGARRGCMQHHVSRIAHADDRVTPVIIDVTDWAQIKRAVESVESLEHPNQQRRRCRCLMDLSDRAAFEHHFDVNVYGPLIGDPGAACVADPRAGDGSSTSSRSGRSPRCRILPAYSASKAGGVLGDAVAARAAGRTGREGSCVLPGPIDTEMIPRPARSRKTPPEAGSAGERSSTEWRTRRGDLPRPVLGDDDGRELAHGRGQGTRAPELGARPGRAIAA